MYLGIDIGSVTAKVVVIDHQLKIVDSYYIRSHGQPFETVLSIFKQIKSRGTLAESIELIATTGAGGKTLAAILSADAVNEITAQATGTSRYYPQVKTIIEIGGEDAKVIRIETGDSGKKSRADKGVRIIDFTTNTVCAAGTGSFLDQQASRLGIRIEDMGQEALKSARPATIAARCSVFAKTDMIHLQQVGTPITDIIAGLCFAMARNYKSNIAKGIPLEKPISFQGGVAANQGMLRAFREVLELDEKDILIPERFALMGAIGAVLSCLDHKHNQKARTLPELITQLNKYLTERKLELKTLEPLKSDDYKIQIETYQPTKKELALGKIEAYVGVDVGSISTNVVVIDKNNRVLARRYLMTAGKPVEAVRQGLLEVGKEIGDWVTIKGAGSTGSGRHLTGEFFGADVIKNEITSHARAAVMIDPKVDTIFEIGGQDSKYISLKDGVVVDFTMNKVCAAGTGSFLEEQAEKLAVKINREFAQKACESQAPCYLGERCTVFMESQLNYYKQQGVIKEDLLAGLAYSIVDNYLNKVVEKRKIGERIFFQGGVGFNRAVKSAFEQVVGKPIIVPPHHDILGAIGVAIIAKEQITSEMVTRFKGFDLRNVKYESRSFECKECPNNCEIHQVKISQGGPARPADASHSGGESGVAGTPAAGPKILYYGSRCGKFDNIVLAHPGPAGTEPVQALPNLFRERQRMLLHSRHESDEAEDWMDDERKNRPTMGIPRIAAFFDLFPMWNAFFTELGFKVVVSDETNRAIIKRGVENVVAEPCFPIKTAHGHILNLLEKKTDYIFIPFQVNMPPLSQHFDRSYNCPYIQALPDITKSAIDYKKYNTKVLRPVFYMDRGRGALEKSFRNIVKDMAGFVKPKTFGAVEKKRAADFSKLVDGAIRAAFAAQDKFDAWQANRGQQMLDNLSAGNHPAVVLVSRSYNSYDIGLNLNLVEKLQRLGLQVVPIDFLPLKALGQEIGPDYPYMYWRSGQKILAAARYIARQKNLFAIYLTNFNCGPDSYITKFFDKEMRGKSYLALEIDEHSADVGMQTRCEAFFDTIKNVPANQDTEPQAVTSTMTFSSFTQDGKTIYIPYMDDHGYVVAAAMRAAGLKAEALPPSDEQSLFIGRKHTSGRECFPSIITTGDIIKKSQKPDFNAGHSAFFMPTAKGPCRFGQYNKLHRMVLDEIGLTNVDLITFDQTSGFQKDFAAINSTKVKKTIWQGLVIVDLMQKLSRETRPYELNKGETDRVYTQSLQGLEVFMADPAHMDVGAIAQTVIKLFDRIKTDYAQPKPRIGIIGEIYVRSNPFTNNYLIRQLEQLGAEVTCPPFEEWLDYIDFVRAEDYLIQGDYLSWLKQKITLVFQEWEAKKIRRHFQGKIRNFYLESPTAEVIECGLDYLSPALRGEAILSLGRAVEYAQQGYNGIINIIPFGCMPGTIVMALLKRFKDDHNLPVLTLTMDGMKNPAEEMKIEAFVRQCQETITK